MTGRSGITKSKVGSSSTGVGVGRLSSSPVVTRSGGAGALHGELAALPKVAPKHIDKPEDPSKQMPNLPDLTALQQTIHSTLADALKSKDFIQQIVAAVVDSVTQAVIHELEKNVKYNNEKVSELEAQLTLQTNRVAELENKLLEQMSDLEQYQRRNNVRIFGIAEQENENCDQSVLNVLRNQLKLQDFDINDIGRCHRVGVKRPGSRRPIIVQFSTYRRREVVIRNRKLLKGTNVVIREDLTSRRLSLMKAAVNKYGYKNVWTVLDGRIMVSDAGKVKCVCNVDELK